MVRSAIIVSAVVGALSGATALRAQDVPPASAAASDLRLAPRTRVRLTVRADTSAQRLAESLVSTVSAIGPDSVHVLVAGDTVPVAFPWTAVSRVEVSRGPRVSESARVPLVLLGSIAGVVLGAQAGRAMLPEPCSGKLIRNADISYGFLRLGAVLGGGVLGAALTLAVTGIERWSGVAVPQQVTVRPAGRGVAVALQY